MAAASDRCGRRHLVQRETVRGRECRGGTLGADWYTFGAEALGDRCVPAFAIVAIQRCRGCAVLLRDGMTLRRNRGRCRGSRAGGFREAEAQRFAERLCCRLNRQRDREKQSAGVHQPMHASLNYSLGSEGPQTSHNRGSIRHRCARRSLNALTMTDTELNVIAALAQIGLINTPMNG